MRALLTALLAAATLSACGDADPAPVVTSDTTVETVAASDPGAADAAVAAEAPTTEPAAAQTAATPAPATPVAAPAATAPAGPTTEQCRSDVAPGAAEGELYGVVPEQTFAFTSPAYGAGCFVTGAFREGARAEGLSGPDYLFLVTDATGASTTALEFAADALPEPYRLAAVGFADVNADGVRDVLVVSDDCDGFVWIASGERWEPMPPYSGTAGLEACTVAEAKTAFRDMFAEPVSP